MATQVTLPLMDLFRANIGKPLTSDEIREALGLSASTSSISSAVHYLRQRGWVIAKPTRSQYQCVQVGSAAIRGDNQPRAVGNPEKGQVVSRDIPAVVAPPETFCLVPGDLMEVLHVSRSGTVLLEDTEGRQYTAKAVG